MTLKVIASSLNLRGAPSTSAPILETLPMGTTLTPVDPGPFRLVRTPSGRQGWVHANYVGEKAEAPVAGWRVAESLNTLRRQLDATGPKRKKGYDGTIGDEAHQQRKSDHNPIDPPPDAKDRRRVVTAEDFTNDPAGGLDAGVVAEGLRRSGDKRIKYIIWNHRITSRDKSGWVAYTGPNPHDHHFHISVVSDPALYDDPSPWKLG